MKTPKKTAGKASTNTKLVGVKRANSPSGILKTKPPMEDEDEDLEMPLDDDLGGLGFDDYDDDEEY